MGLFAQAVRAAGRVLQTDRENLSLVLSPSTVPLCYVRLVFRSKGPMSPGSKFHRGMALGSWFSDLRASSKERSLPCSAFFFCRLNHHVCTLPGAPNGVWYHVFELSRKRLPPAPPRSLRASILSQQGHRRGVEPCSWFLRNFVPIVAVLLFVVGILVNYDIVGNDVKAGGTG